MPGPTQAQATPTVGDGQLSFQITAYESSNVYVKADVLQPSISLFNESTGHSTYTTLTVDASNQIDPNPVVVTGLTNNVEYMWEIITNSGADASGHAVGTSTPLGAPGQAVLGDGTYPSSGGVKVPVTIDTNGTAITKYKVQVYNTATNDTETKYFTSGTDFDSLSANDRSITITDGDWTSLTTSSQSATVFIQAAPSSGLYSNVASRQYSLVATPAAPTAFAMSDSNVVGEGLFASVTVPTYAKLSGTNYFIDIDACGNDASTWNNVASQQIIHDKTIYHFSVSAALGIMQTYKARVREVMSNGTVLYSTYADDIEQIMNQHSEAGTLVAEQLTNSGSNATYPAADFDYFKLSYAGSTSSFGTRYIATNFIDVSGTDITASSGLVDVSGVTPAADDAIGGHAIPADGNLDLYCFVQHMQLIDSLDDNRTFSIAASGVKGKYSADQIRSGASSSAQNINSAIILSNTIIERPVLEKPAQVSAANAASENQQIAATWTVTTPNAAENKTATSFDVSLYLANNAGNALTTINTTNYHHTFDTLTNGVGYKIGVKAKNAAGSAAEVMSSLATPVTSMLPNDTIFNIVLSDVPNTGGSNGTNVNMTCDVNKPTGFKINTIEIESIDQYGTTTGLTDISAANVNTGFAGAVTRKPVEAITTQDYNGIHRYRFRAHSMLAAVNNEHNSQPHAEMWSEWEYAQIDLTQKPRITSFTYDTKAATRWAAKSTDIVVKAKARGLDIEAATTNVIAVPGPEDGVNMNIDNMVHALTNPVYTASDSTYTYELTLDYHLLDMDASGATTGDIVAIALVTNADGQAINSQPAAAA
jgi:hypothetical protein